MAGWAENVPTGDKYGAEDLISSEMPHFLKQGLKTVRKIIYPMRFFKIPPVFSAPRYDFGIHRAGCRSFCSLPACLAVPETKYASDKNSANGRL